MNKIVFLIGTRWFGVINPCKIIIQKLHSDGFEVFIIENRDKLINNECISRVKFIDLVKKRSYYNFLNDIFSLFNMRYRILLLVKKDTF